MRYPVSVEGFERQEIEVEVSGIFATDTLLQNGQPVHPKGRWKRAFTLTRDDGHEVQCKWKWRSLGLDVPSLEVDREVV